MCKFRLPFKINFTLISLVSSRESSEKTNKQTTTPKYFRYFNFLTAINKRSVDVIPFTDYYVQLSPYGLVVSSCTFELKEFQGYVKTCV